MIICEYEGERVVFPNVQAVLDDINVDRSEDWTDYNKNDWKDGLANFTQYDLVEVNNRRMKPMNPREDEVLFAVCRILDITQEPTEFTECLKGYLEGY
jgi:hypothetical protein